MLRMVTFTGADETTDIRSMLELTREFPFIEWGILASSNESGHGGRYPQISWIKTLQRFALNNPGRLNLSLHLCGLWTRQFMLGFVNLPFYISDGFQRVQLNFHAERIRCEPVRVQELMHSLGQTFIFQIDGSEGNLHMEGIIALNAEAWMADVLPLFDVSGGSGILPTEWPRTKYYGPYGSKLLHGYAGGLGPHNLEAELPKILAASGGCDIWIDMETHVRTNDSFDLAKVKACAEIAKPFATPF